VLHIHGTADPIIPYYGGTGVAYGLSGRAITTPPIPAINAEWRAIDKCARPSVTTKGIVTTSIAACAGRRTVELITLKGMGHEWPGGDSPAHKIVNTGPTTDVISATKVIWQFFATHPR
jgi:polyhydroxybutyrate depolymerase